MAIRGPERALRWPQEGPRRPQDASKRRQDDPKTAPEAAKTPQEASKRPQKRAPRGPNHQFHNGFCKILGFPRFRLPDAPRRPQKPPRAPQDGPRAENCKKLYIFTHFLGPRERAGMVRERAGTHRPGGMRGPSRREFVQNLCLSRLARLTPVVKPRGRRIASRIPPGLG